MLSAALFTSILTEFEAAAEEAEEAEEAEDAAVAAVAIVAEAVESALLFSFGGSATTAAATAGAAVAVGSAGAGPVMEGAGVIGADESCGVADVRGAAEVAARLSGGGPTGTSILLAASVTAGLTADVAAVAAAAESMSRES